VAAAAAAPAVAKGAKRKAAAAAGGEPKAAKKPWRPRYKTANWALLVTLDRLAKQGRTTVTKAELVRAPRRLGSCSLYARALRLLTPPAPPGG